MVEKPPAYLWYPGDMLSSGNVAELSASEECWYRRALDFAWKDGGVPSDPEKFAKRIGKGCTKKAAEMILGTFFVVDPKRPDIALNKKQEKIRKEHTVFRKKKSEAGKKGMEKRWKSNKHTSSGDNSVNNTAITQPITNHITKHNLSSSSSSSSSREEESSGRGVKSSATGSATTPAEKMKSDKSNGVSGHPAVVVYEEIFGPANAAFNKAVSLAVTDLGLWSNLVTEKSSYKKPYRWILGEYHKRVGESPPSVNTGKPPGRIKTAREFAREAIEQMENGAETRETGQ